MHTYTKDIEQNCDLKFGTQNELSAVHVIISAMAILCQICADRERIIGHWILQMTAIDGYDFE